MDARGRFQGRRIDSTCLRWAFCSAKHGWKSFLNLNSFPAHIRDFKNLKSTWHQMLARSHQLQGIFGLLKPFIHVHILICFVEVYQNHGVLRETMYFAQKIFILPGVRWLEPAGRGKPLRMGEEVSLECVSRGEGRMRPWPNITWFIGGHRVR